MTTFTFIIYMFCLIMFGVSHFLTKDTESMIFWGILAILNSVHVTWGFL